MGGIKSRRKGKRGEDAVADRLGELGLPAIARSEDGKRGGRDVILEAWPELHIEVKNQAGMVLGGAGWFSAISQARSNCLGEPWLVIWKTQRGTWAVTFDGSLGLTSIELDRVADLIDELRAGSPEARRHVLEHEVDRLTCEVDRLEEVLRLSR